MKPIDITPQQQLKLAEMCINLFPEYDFTLQKFRECHVTLGLKTKDLYETHIHWFEFCMTHLAKKLGTPNDFIRYQTTGNFMYVHPVDYFFEKFKQNQS